MDFKNLKEALDILSKAKCVLSYEDYVNIWGEQIGDHIWRQEGSDLLRIWRGGLTNEQAESFVNYLLEKSLEKQVIEGNKAIGQTGLTHEELLVEARQEGFDEGFKSAKGEGIDD